MDRKSRRHTNSGFSRFTDLILADILMSGILGMIFIGIWSPEDKGIVMKLSPYYYETEDTIKVLSSNILHLDIDSISQLFINDSLYSFSMAEEKIHDFILGKVLNNRKPHLWIKVNKHSAYRYYIELLDAIRKAEKTIVDDLSIRHYGKLYFDMPHKLRTRIRNKISLFMIEEDELGKPYFLRSPISLSY